LDREKRVCPLFTLNNFLNFLWGSLRGRSPQAKLWVRKAEGLIKGRVGYEFLDKAKGIKSLFFIDLNNF